MHFGSDCFGAIKLYEKALGANVKELITEGGRVYHAELEIMGARLLMTDEDGSFTGNAGNSVLFLLMFDSPRVVKN